MLNAMLANNIMDINGNFEKLVSVIIPTTCEEARAQLLMRAIDSVINQDGVLFEILVIVNGNKVDPRTLDSLLEIDVVVIQVEEGNVSNARYQGVLASRGEYFCFLDDDDELLSKSLFNRVDFLKKNHNFDVVVCNGYIHFEFDDLLVGDDLAVCISVNPILGFFEKNWFASAGPMFRRRGIDCRLFDIKVKYFELTYLLFLLVSQSVGIKFINTIGYRIYINHPISVSRSEEYALAEADVLFKISKLSLSEVVKKLVFSRYADALHTASNLFINANRLRDAWVAHLKCIRYGGWKYISYTRYLIGALFVIK